MRDRIRCWARITAALAVGLLVYAAANRAQVREVVFAYETLLISKCGTPEQVEALTDKAGYLLAAERGDLELYRARKAFREALDAQRRLAQLDEGLADYAIAIATMERDAGHAVVAQNSP